MEQSEKIRCWVIAYLKGEMNDVEKGQLEEWLNQDRKNREWFESYVKKEQLPQSLELYISFRTAERWQELERQLFINSRRLKLRRWFAYAAILTLLLTGSITYLWFNTHDPKPLKIAGLDKVMRNQAILVTETGEQLVLNGIRDTCLLVGKTEWLNINELGNLIYQKDSLVTLQEETWHTIRVPQGGEYKLTLNDGTQVWLNSASELSFPVHFSGTERKVKLSGEAYFEVTKNNEKPFVVHLGKQKVEVLGTFFDVTAYPDDTCIYTTLLNGRVLVSEGENSEMLTPGEQAVFDGKKFTVRKVNANLYCSWIRDRFVFTGENLEMVARKLERWYNVQFFFANESLKTESFTGSIPKYAELSQVLKMLEMTASIRFTQKGLTVVVEAIP